MIIPRWALPVAIAASLITSHALTYRHGVSVEQARNEAALAGKLTAAYGERDVMLAEVEFQRAALENELEKAINENRIRDDRISSGAQRVYVRANCPALPATTSNAGGPTAIAAELDPRYRHVVSRLRERALTMESWARKCQVELKARSQ